jgi:hypothetical protein
MPGRRSTIVYRPFSLVVSVRDLSISASLAASTFTPAITAPELSRTCPEMVLWAEANDAKSPTIGKTAKQQPAKRFRVIFCLLHAARGRGLR